MKQKLKMWRWDLKRDSSSKGPGEQRGFAFSCCSRDVALTALWICALCQALHVGPTCTWNMASAHLAVNCLERIWRPRAAIFRDFIRVLFFKGITADMVCAQPSPGYFFICVSFLKKTSTESPLAVCSATSLSRPRPHSSSTAWTSGILRSIYYKRLHLKHVSSDESFWTRTCTCSPGLKRSLPPAKMEGVMVKCLKPYSFWSTVSNPSMLRSSISVPVTPRIHA